MWRYALFSLALFVMAGGRLAHAGQFQSHVDYAAIFPQGIALADLNSDGRLDLVTANYLDGSVSVLLGNGDGTLQPYVDYNLGISGPRTVAVGDLNGDGKPDLVTADENINGVSVLLGNGDGTFQSSRNYVTAVSPFSVVLGDFNRDGKLDVAVATTDYRSVVMSVLLGNGDGTLRPRADYATGGFSFSMAVGDVDNDGKLDLVTANYSNKTVSVLLGNGDGTFQPHIDYNVAGALSVALADINRDGDADLVTTGGSAVSVLLGNGDGTFQPHVDYRTGGSSGSDVGSVVVGDLGGDGKLDLVTSNYSHNSVSILLGNGDGTFQPHQDYATGNNPLAVVIGDFNRDAAPDVASTSDYSVNTVSLLLNTGGTFVSTTSSLNPSKLGQPITFTTSVMASLQGESMPTGTVTFKDGALTLGTADVVSGTASFTTNHLNIGIHKIRAKYSGDATLNPHQGVPVVQKVQP